MEKWLMVLGFMVGMLDILILVNFGFVPFLLFLLGKVTGAIVLGSVLYSKATRNQVL